MRGLLTAVTVSLLCLAPPSFAQDVNAGEADPFEAAHDQSVELYRAGRYADSLAKLKEAYELQPLATLLYNMAMCYQKLGRHGEELKHLELFRDAAPDLRHDTKRARNVETRITELRNLLGIKSQQPQQPVHKRWWFWTVMGVAAAGAAASIAGGVASTQGGPAVEGAGVITGSQRRTPDFMVSLIQFK